MLLLTWQSFGSMEVAQVGDTVLIQGAGSASLVLSEGAFARGLRFYASGKGKVFFRLLAGNEKGEVFAGVKEVELSEEPQLVELKVDFNKGNLRMGSLAPMRPRCSFFVDAQESVSLKIWGIEPW